MTLTDEKIDQLMIAALPQPQRQRMQYQQGLVGDYIQENQSSWEHVYDAVAQTYVIDEQPFAQAANDEIIYAITRIKHCFNSEQEFAVHLFWLSTFHSVAKAYAEALIEKKRYDTSDGGMENPTLVDYRNAEIIEKSSAFLKDLEQIGIAPALAQQVVRNFADSVVNALQIKGVSGGEVSSSCHTIVPMGGLYAANHTKRYGKDMDSPALQSAQSAAPKKPPSLSVFATIVGEYIDARYEKYHDGVVARHPGVSLPRVIPGEDSALGSGYRAYGARQISKLQKVKEALPQLDQEFSQLVDELIKGRNMNDGEKGRVTIVAGALAFDLLKPLFPENERVRYIDDSFDTKRAARELLCALNDKTTPKTRSADEAIRAFESGFKATIRSIAGIAEPECGRQ
ncbi:MAG: hypothetical protein V4735_07280 [Pseudomonadota bacterium]